MKKESLSLFLALSAASVSFATEPYTIPSSAIIGFSPDNSVAAGQLGGSVLFYDLKTGGQPLVFAETEDGTVSYNLGVGNFIGNNIILTDRSQYGSSAWRWNETRGLEGGRWTALNPDDKLIGLGLPNGVVPDGSRICGTVATGQNFGASDEDATMTVPCIWNLVNNSYERVALPHNPLDYADRAPQYITATNISADGNIIVGQSVSHNGFLVEQLVYRCNEAGEWSYESPFADLINPNKLVLPEFPEGEAPAIPMPEAFLDQEGSEEYLAALELYQQGLGLEPDPADYLTPDSIASFNRQVEIYNAWAIKAKAWYDVNAQILEQSTSMAFNQTAISPNGRYFVCSAGASLATPDGEINNIYVPILYDLENRTRIEIPTDQSILVTAVSNLGDIIGYNRMSDIDFGYALPAGAAEWVPLEKYIVDRNPELQGWPEKNLIHRIPVEINDEGDISEELMTVTGMPIVSPDFSHISLVAYHFWEDAPDEYYGQYCSTIIDLGSDRNSIDSIPASAPGSDNRIYDLQGRPVANPTRGIYISNGKKFIIK